ncbi:MAG: ribonuclease III [Opitutales bacterium]
MEEGTLNTTSLEAALGHTFASRELLLTALTHPSYTQFVNSKTDNYQRLEFLGDAALSLILAEHLYQAYPLEREGTLAQARSALAKGSTLSTLAKKLHLSNYLRLSPAEREAGGGGRPSILEDTMEALIGALFLDSNYEKTKSCVLNCYPKLPKNISQLLEKENPKGKLQEHFQQQNPTPPIEYKLLQAEGPDHAKSYLVEIHIDGTHYGQGSGSSKKEAEENAAREALKQL